MTQLTGPVDRFLDDVTAAWATNDGDQLGRLFADDGTLINPFGQRADGRAAVTAMYAEFFDGMLKGTTTTISLQSLREVAEGHAFADGKQTILGPGGEVVLVAHLATLLRHESGGWRFVDCRPYTFAAPPS